MTAQAPKMTITPGQPLDIESFQAAQNSGKPKMIFVTTNSKDKEVNEKTFG
jgi:hypothetical protein